MSQTTPVVEKNTANHAKQPLVPPDERFWQRYSPHGELPLSGAGSLALHLLIFGLMLLSAWLAYAVFGHTSRSLPVEAVRLDLGGGGGNPQGVGDGPNRGKPLEAGSDKEEEGVAKPDPVGTEERPDLTVKPTTPQRTEFENPVRYIQQTNTPSSKAMQRLADSRIRIQLPDREPSGRGKGGTGEGGGSGDGKGTGTGKGTGEGHGNLTQREKRMLRWSMLFDTRNGRDYLAQLQGLKAILAIPTDASGKDYKIIRDLSARPAKLLEEDISKIQRIYWIDDKPESVRDVMSILGVKLQPSHFVAFMPEDLERQLFEMEKKYLEKHHPGLSEDNITVTRFKINRTGKGFKSEVIGQEVEK
ncbi:MAG TPA: hypothetical protein VH682_08650 [Gemmataceae bacterium]|jgi:hypothetical protein